MGVDEALERGRELYANRAWVDAYESLVAADHQGPRVAADLELLARSAYMLGRDDDCVSALERAHNAHVESGDIPSAVRCAFWVGHNMMFRGQSGPAGGWFARGQRLLEREALDCPERGYLLIPVLIKQSSNGVFDAAYATATEAAEIGERSGDSDLFAIGLMEQGHALVLLGRTSDGLRLARTCTSKSTPTSCGAPGAPRRARLGSRDTRERAVSAALSPSPPCGGLSVYRSVGREVGSELSNRRSFHG